MQAEAGERMWELKVIPHLKFILITLLLIRTKKEIITVVTKGTILEF
jgi:hypothetical protein